jgi:carbonic anhydrase
MLGLSLLAVFSMGISGEATSFNTVSADEAEALPSINSKPSNLIMIGNTEALLLSCIDYRLTNETENYMASRGLAHNYDHVMLAGASLGAHNKKFPNWEQTFLDQVDVAISLHHIHKVIVMDHRDCGAYRVILGYESLDKEPNRETSVHKEQMESLTDIIQEKHPDLDVEMLLMGLDGKVEKVDERKGHKEEHGEQHHE